MSREAVIALAAAGVILALTAILLRRRIGAASRLTKNLLAVFAALAIGGVTMWIYVVTPRTFDATKHYMLMSRWCLSREFFVVDYGEPTLVPPGWGIAPSSIAEWRLHRSDWFEQPDYVAKYGERVKRPKVIFGLYKGTRIRITKVVAQYSPHQHMTFIYPKARIGGKLVNVSQLFGNSYVYPNPLVANADDAVLCNVR
jgi:hypothetical protein